MHNDPFTRFVKNLVTRDSVELVARDLNVLVEDVDAWVSGKAFEHPVVFRYMADFYGDRLDFISSFMLYGASFPGQLLKALREHLRTELRWFRVGSGNRWIWVHPDSGHLALRVDFTKLPHDGGYVANYETAFDTDTIRIKGDLGYARLSLEDKFLTVALCS